MPNSVTIKSELRTSLTEALFNDILTRGNRYYYFLGRPLEWYNPVNPPISPDSENSNKQIRNDIVIVKEIRPGDASFVVPRKNWTSNVVYDVYDDTYSTELIGVDIVNGGRNYSASTTATVLGSNTDPAVISPIITSGNISGFTILNSGAGYTTPPVIQITDTSGLDANAIGVISRPYSGAGGLANANFYVLTTDFNIYKCLDNNGNSPSTVMPTGTFTEPFTLGDGYKWKFMGILPPGLRSRFLTVDYMPVVRALNENFYSSGEIRSVSILNSGEGYTSTPSITVSGDGYQELNPILISSSVTINDRGRNYTAANIVIDPPIAITGNWTANTLVYPGSILRSVNNLYEVIYTGNTLNTRPIHTAGSVTCGTAGLKFRGIVATGNVTLGSGATAGNIIGVTLDAVLGGATLTNGGTGYISAPSITFTGGTGSGAQGYATISGGSVNRINITNPGSYTVAPSLLIGTQWAANSRVFLNDQVYFNENLYTVTADSGNAYTQLGTVSPTHTSGTVVSGNASLTFAGLTATGTVSLVYGSGYITTPTANIVGNGSGVSGSNATVTLNSTATKAILAPILDSGKIIGVSIGDRGIGYSSATLTVSGGGGSNASIIANLSEGDLLSIQTNNELLAVDGAIDRIAIISKGYGYTQATTNVVIGGDGSGATANATVINGRVEKINVLTRGQGYSKANVTITGIGKGAAARAVLPPTGGHGKNIVSELFASYLALSTTITNEKNQGFDVTNDYRQFGIIKNPLAYNGNRLYSSSVGSACWVITTVSSIDPAVVKDSIVTIQSKNASYVVISVGGNNMLVSSIDGVDPVIGDSITLGSNTGVITSVVSPDIDKYSGTLLYVDNRTSFATIDQTASFKTVLSF